MSAPPPEGEFIFFHSGLRTKYFDPANKAHFYSNLLVEVVYNDRFDGRWWGDDLRLPRHDRAGEQQLIPIRFYHAQTRYKYMYVGYGESPNTQNDHRRLRLWADLSRSTSVYAGNAPQFVFLVLPIPTKKEEWIWLDLSFPIRAIYIPKAHKSSPTLTDRCTYYSLQLAQREISVPLKYGLSGETREKKWHFNPNRQRGWWVWRNPDGSIANSHRHNLAGYADEQVQMSVGFNIPKLAVELALLGAKIFDGDHQRIYDDCVQLHHNVKLWHDAFCLNPKVEPHMTWNMLNSGPNGARVASAQFGTDFDWKKLDPAWYVEVVKGTIEFGASMVPLVGPILAAGMHTLMDAVLYPEDFKLNSNVLDNVAGVGAAVGRMSAIAKPLIRQRVLKNFKKLLDARRRKVGPAPNPGNKNTGKQVDKGKNSGTQGTETAGGLIGGGGVGTGAGVTDDDEDDDFEETVRLILEDPEFEYDDSEDFDLEEFLKNAAKFFKEQLSAVEKLDLGNLTLDVWNRLGELGLRVGDDPLAHTPIPSEPPVETLLAGSGSDYHIEIRDDGVYLACTTIDLDGEDDISEIRLDDHIGNNDGNFKWGEEDFSFTAEDISFEIRGIKFLLFASLLGPDNEYHPGHCIDLVGGIGIQNGELVKLERPAGMDDNDHDDEGGEGNKDPGSSYTPRLDAGQTLEVDDWLVSNNQKWTLLFQHDGNLVLYDHGKAYWHSNTANNSSGTGSINARLEEDGNFVVSRTGGGFRWQSRSNGYGAKKPYILVQDDGNVCLYDEEVEGCHWAARDI